MLEKVNCDKVLNIFSFLPSFNIFLMGILMCMLKGVFSDNPGIYILFPEMLYQILCFKLTYRLIDTITTL